MAIFDHAVAALGGVRKELEPRAMEQTALTLVRASRVELWGQGASAAVAADTAHKLLRVCRGVVERADVHMQAMAAATLNRVSVVICISHTGRTRELIEVA